MKRSGVLSTHSGSLGSHAHSTPYAAITIVLEGRERGGGLGWSPNADGPSMAKNVGSQGVSTKDSSSHTRKKLGDAFHSTRLP